MRTLLLAMAVLLGAAGPSPAADPPAPAAQNAPADANAAASVKRPNVLIVTLDTTRADHTSAYGYSRPTTPRLAEFAKQGVRFETAYAPMATTLPSHTTMFTGLLPRTHGTLKNGLPVDASLPLLSEILDGAGYRTAAFLSSFAVSSKFGLQRGFDLYDDDFRDGQCKWDVTRWEGHKLEGDFCRRGDLTRARAEAWLEQNGYLPASAAQDGSAAKASASAASSAAQRPSEPFYVWIHFFDAHNPYDPPEEHAKLFPPLGNPPTELDREIAKYDAEIHFADQEMGKLFDRLAAAKLLDDTLVIVAGDHGEGLMDHGWMLHGLQIYEEAVRVPFVVRWPAKVPAGKVIAEPVELADMTPTVLELTGIAMPNAKHAPEGMSLAAAMAGKATLDAKRPVLVQRRFYASDSERGVKVKGSKHGLRLGDWKYIEAKEEDSFELYDLKSDPGEKTNLATARPGERDTMATRLATTLSSTAVAAPAPRTVSEEDARRLEALGYVQ
jgi:arylsulfatase A-like enzyme